MTRLVFMTWFPWLSCGAPETDFTCMTPPCGSSAVAACDDGEQRTKEPRADQPLRARSAREVNKPEIPRNYSCFDVVEGRDDPRRCCSYQARLTVPGRGSERVGVAVAAELSCIEARVRGQLNL